jgi:pimeloyl-ACP methyl ester carboxylesterase
VSLSPVPAHHLTPYDRFCWSDAEVERMLASGEQRRALAAYFGEGEYRALARLARRAQRAGIKSRLPHVLVIPGMLGSQLGLRRRPPLPDDVLWMDPLDIQNGRLPLLDPAARAPVVPLGVVLFSYLRLTLYLRARGFAVTLYPYDWRLGIETAAAALAHILHTRHTGRVAIVAHSMGGLVTRAALALPAAGHVERAVLLGTPNLGALTPLQALRGSYSVVRNMARLDLHRSAEELSAQVFSGFVSLYQMLPGPECGVDLMDKTQWPSFGPLPRAELLAHARGFLAGLPAPDARFAAIAGVGIKTATALSRRRDEFVYTVTRGGDGTVPAASAALNGASSYYAPVAHNDLTRDARIASALVDLLSEGSTRRLPTRWHSRSRAQARIGDRQLYRLRADKLNWPHMTPAQRQAFLQNLSEPPPLRLRVPLPSKKN